MKRGVMSYRLMGVWMMWGAALGTDGGCSNRCEGSLSEVGSGCAPTYDGTEAALTCGPYPVSIAVRHCAALTAVTFSGGYVGWDCFYDARSGALVGASSSSDIPAFCDESSFSQSAGRTPPASCFSQPADIVVQCRPPTSPDGGP